MIISAKMDEASTELFFSGLSESLTEGSVVIQVIQDSVSRGHLQHLSLSHKCADVIQQLEKQLCQFQN